MCCLAAGEVPFEIQPAQVLHKAPVRYAGWPTIALAPNGDLVAVFSGDRSAHISNDGKVQMVRSVDGGQTWGAAETVFDTPIDDRDSGIVRTRDGTMLASWFTGPYGGEWQGHWVIRSSDNGKTWGAPIRTENTTPHGPVQLSDGRLLLMGQRPHCSHGTPGDWNGPPTQSPYSVVVTESGDDGQSWKLLSTFPVPEDAQMLSYDEAHLVEAANGTLVALFRDCNGENHLRQSESGDGGRTWSPPRVTAIRGYPPHLIRLQNDWLLVSYAKRWEPFGAYAWISRDNGQTWDIEHEVRLSVGRDGDLGYPASVQLADGSIWTVYYQSDRPGEPPCLMGTHWRLNP
jgi:Neuraminidase (sialidase)